MELAARPETNLPKIAELFGPTIYFIDTVFAWGLVTCEDPAHPMTRLDDLKWKTRLCLLAKQHFGLFGSEEGREWAVPCADYLEGIFSHQTDSPPGSVIPLFPLVYNDCVQLLTHQSDRIGPGDEKKVADHILFAEMPLPQFWAASLLEAGGRDPHQHGAARTAGERISADASSAITYRWKLGQAFPGMAHSSSISPSRRQRPAKGSFSRTITFPKVPMSRGSRGSWRMARTRWKRLRMSRGQYEIWTGVLHDGQRVALGHALARRPAVPCRHDHGSTGADRLPTGRAAARH